MVKRAFFILSALLIVLVLSIMVSGPVYAQTFGTNWTAQFYPSTNFTGTPVTASFPNGINKDWGTGVPTDGAGATIAVPADFSAVFSSTQNFATAGAYTFLIRYNDGVEFSVDGQTVVTQLTDFPEPGSTTYRESTFTVNLSAGNHTLVARFVDYDQQALLQIQWVLGGSSATAVPTATPLPPAIGTVRQVRGLAVRTGPYLGASLIAVARPDVSYPILARNTDEGLYEWFRISIGDSSGWVSGRYFITAGNFSSVYTEGTIFDQIDNAPSKGVTGVTRSVMNFRRRPSERATLLGQIPWGGEVDILGRTIQGGQNFWFHVRWEGRVGWIYAPFVGIRGPIDAVPIY